MYATYYGLSAKPFQLRPDPHFFFGSKGHQRAMAYLDYGLEQGEGFIVITGEVGAGKTTLVRNLFRKLASDKIHAVQIVNTHLDADDILRMVACGFDLPYEGLSKAALLTGIEQWLRDLGQRGKRALLVVDEAQNLSPRAVEELRMLSNFQSAEQSLLQTFLLGQPEFRATLNGAGMRQLRQRVIAAYHLGPMDAPETRTYIEHRLRTVGWRGAPSISDTGFDAIYAASGGIPRRINALCDRLFLMGYLEEIRHFGADDVAAVIDDIDHEFDPGGAVPAAAPGPLATLEHMDARIAGIERSVLSALDAIKSLLGARKPPVAP
jgi:general secretion pathway protein A